MDDRETDELVIVKSSFMDAARWFLFIPVYFTLYFLLTQSGNEFLTYFAATLAATLIATFIAPSKRIAIILVFTCITVLPLFIPLFGNMYSSLQIIYMVTASALALATIYATDGKYKRSEA
jgi:hypothetical protein